MWSRQSDVAPRLSEQAHEPGGVLAEGALPRTGPAVAGDILIRTVMDGAHRLFTVSAVPGPDQFRCASLAEASRVAREYASQCRADVWTDDGTGRLTRLVRFRTVEVAHSEGTPSERASGASAP
jgi:hypothetical protein